MTTRINLQPAYVLHARPYRETSMLLDLFTREHGRISMIARGVRTPKSQKKGLLQAFVPILVSWVGKSELVTLTHVDMHHAAPRLHAKQLVCGLYINELLMRLLYRFDPHPNLFIQYAEALVKLSSSAQTEFHLRAFEKALLAEIGYGIQYDKDVKTGKSIAEHMYYRYDHDLGGFVELNTELQTDHKAYSFSGSTLLALQKNTFGDQDLRDIKRLMRMIIGRLLGNKPLKTRDILLGGGQ